MPDLVGILKNTLGADAVLSAKDVSGRAISFWDNSPMSAKALVRPKTTAEVSEILKLCHAHGQSVVTQGGNTTCVQGTTTCKNDIILSFERMNKIIEIDPIACTAIFEAGVILETAQRAVQEHNLFLPLDLGARGSCTLGGNLATNAGGVNVLRYGMARAMVLGLEAVLADGTIISSMNKMLKNNAGYDLKQLFIGSEGTLGIITRMVVKLMPLPVTKNTAFVALPDFSAVYKLLNHMKANIGTSLSAFEVMWGAYYQAVTEPGGHRAPLERQHPFYVLLECDGSDPERDDDRFIQVIEQAFAAAYIIDAIVPQSESERQSLWTIRDDFEPVLKEKSVFFLYDVSLPILSMENYVNEVQTRLNELLPGAAFHVFGHVGDGNLHFFVQPDAKNQTFAKKQLKHLSDTAIYKPLQQYGGSISAEHGIGLEKKQWLNQSRNEAEIALMKLLKTTLDPKNILNAGRVLD